MTFDPFQSSTLLIVLPELLLVVLAGLVLALDLVWPESRKRGLGLLAATGFGVIAVLALVFTRPEAEARLVLGGMLRSDFLAYFFRLLFLVAGMVVAMISLDSPGVARKGEYYAILAAAVLGLDFMAASADLIMLYLSVETTSIALYLLAGYLREDDKSAEAGLKYFLFGAFTSTVMLYGFSLLYGFTGRTNLYDLSAALAAGAVPLPAVLFSALLVLVGFGFKVSAVPFHFWAPDVYEGAPTPITAFISAASKAAGFAVLMRVLLAVFPGVEAYWSSILAAVAVVTMTVGNMLALAQKNIKRLLAYSSIAQAGYALVGLAAASETGASATIYYLAMYVLTNLAAFGAIILITRAAGTDDIGDFAGMSRRAPGLSLAFMVAFLSLGGMPPLAGFFGKFYVFAAAVEAGLIWLAVVGVLNAIIGLYYYLTVLKVVYLYPPKSDEKVGVPRAYAVALWLCVLGVLLMGTWAAPWVSLASAAAGNLF